MVRSAGLFIGLALALVPTQHALAALSPEAQQDREKQSVLERDELEGKIVFAISQEHIGDQKTYVVEAHCTYRFLITYPLNWRVLFGWVGPQQYEVERMGEPVCAPKPNLRTDKQTFNKIILNAVASVYAMPLETITPSTPLYKAPDPTRITMDMRILMLRGYLDQRVGCQINASTFMEIRTVGELLDATATDCHQPPGQ